MSEKDMNTIRQIAEDHVITPRPEAWQKLRTKLKAKKSKQRLITYRNISIAAILVSVLSVTVVFSMYLNEKHNPDVFASNEDYSPIALEELSSEDSDPFYSLQYVDGLHQAYSKIGF